MPTGKQGVAVVVSVPNTSAAVNGHLLLVILPTRSSIDCRGERCPVPLAVNGSVILLVRLPAMILDALDKCAL
ncbi:hypothetical protein Zmor_014299 [Zophobas morio]|uniref:Uncharacterized protein n=1 Tax=Zophobas morio TaxID=2755281 RepID=A0AA38MG24_9CUCU|nr:hypothetical protein Zmor_014299 [Zophobas morio]